MLIIITKYELLIKDVAQSIHLKEHKKKKVEYRK